jgi:hypothetical protein
MDFTATLNHYSIQGFVYSGTTGLGGVQVTFADIYKATTSSNGSYTIINIPHGTTGTLTASKTGYTSTYTGNSTFPYSITQNWIGQNFNANVQLCTINGMVKNQDTPSVECW